MNNSPIVEIKLGIDFFLLQVSTDENQSQNFFRFQQNLILDWKICGLRSSKFSQEPSFEMRTRKTLIAKYLNISIQYLNWGIHLRS